MKTLLVVTLQDIVGLVILFVLGLIVFINNRK